MDFELTKAQRDIRRAAREFAKGEFDRELARELDAKHEFPTALWKRACEEGFIGLHFPEEYGGSGYGVLENVLVVEEFCRADSSFGAALMVTDFASENILYYGSEEQKRRYLPAVAEGRMMSAGAITEPEHGSDISTLATTAVRDGDGWRINGVKTFITNAGMAGFYVVMCQTDPAAGHRGQSMFLVDAETEGISVTSVGRKMGIRMVATGEVTFKNVRVPADALLGEEGKGFYQILRFFDESRIETAAQALGTAQGALDRAVAYVKGRTQFGKKIADFQVTQHKLAEMATSIELARLITYKAAWSVDQGRPDSMLTSMAKYFAGRMAVQVCDEAIQLHGGYGYMAEFDVERFYRDVKIAEIYEGTKEIQKHVIASAVLGTARRKQRR